MNCPKCGAFVPDGALWCPKCKEEIGVTQKLKFDKTRWCSACGALVPAGETSCPKCGASLDAPSEAVPAPRRRTRKLDIPSIGDTGMIDREKIASADETHTMTRIESAIPPPSDEVSAEAVHDRLPHLRSVAFAAVLAVVVVGGAALYITHPWNPDANNISATEPADTSMQGYPGRVDSLTAQDQQQVAETTTALDDLSSYYEELGALSEKVADNKTAVIDAAASGDLSAASDLEALSIEVSNLISSIQPYTSGDYADAATNLETLGNWLRNRCDALAEAWQLAEDGSDSTSIIVAAMAGDDYARLFSDNYADWDPAA